MQEEDLSELLYNLEIEATGISNLILQSTPWYLPLDFILFKEFDIMNHDIETQAKAIICYIRNKYLESDFWYQYNIWVFIYNV